VTSSGFPLSDFSIDFKIVDPTMLDLGRSPPTQMALRH
jgi:hypothetical protein